MKYLWLISIILLVIAVAQTAWINIQSPSLEEARHLVSMEQSWIPESSPRPLADFNLVTHNNRSFSRSDMKGHWSVMVFGYTHCPDACPMNLQMLDQAYDIIREDKRITPPKGIFVSVDPDRDSVKRLSAHMSKFESNFTGLTGEKSEIRALIKSLAADYSVTKKDSQVNIDHPVSLFLINPDANLSGMIIHPSSPSILKSNLVDILRSIK